MDGLALAQGGISVQIWDMNAVPHLSLSQFERIDSASPGQAAFAPESLAIVFLDHQGGIAHLYQRTDGHGSLVELNARQIVHEALTRQHERFILVHNHPSGDPTPSPADINATRRLCRIASALDLELVDHLILTPAQYFSFRAAGLL
jgi:DNA repair protein RadC